MWNRIWDLRGKLVLSCALGIRIRLQDCIINNSLYMQYRVYQMVVQGKRYYTDITQQQLSLVTHNSQDQDKSVIQYKHNSRNMAHSGIALEPFEANISGFSLKFKDQNLEDAYLLARAELKLLTTATRRFLVMILLGHLSFHLLDIASALGINPDYTFSTSTWVVHSLLAVTIAGEALFFFCTRLRSLRGFFFSLLEGILLMNTNFSNFESQVFYPFIGEEYVFCLTIGSTFIWAVSLLYLHMHYMRSWMTSLVIYIMIFTEIMCLLFYYYGQRFIEEDTALSTAIDCAYYILIFIWFTGCSIFAIRANELKERQTFYAEYQQRRELAEWQKLLRAIPEPVLFIQRETINFYNKAILDLFGLQQNPVLEERNAAGRLYDIDRNPEVEEAFKKESETIMGQLVYLKEKKSKETLLGIIRSSESAEKLAEESLFVYKKDGQKRLLMIKRVQTSSGAIDAGVVEYIFHDVTALKTLESEKAKERCFDILLATASHDIRTPLNIMLGTIDVLSDCAVTFEAKEQINVARGCGQKMLYYLQGLKLVRKVNTGTLVTTKHLFDPAAMIKKVHNTFEFAAHLKHLTLDLDVDHSVPAVVCSDKEIYPIILHNLMENALKYTFTGGIKVSASYDSAKKLLITTVADTGIGMSEKKQQSVGRLFKKSKNEYNQLNPQGLGLGLFLVKTLAYQLDGLFTVSSVENTGTTATFTVADYSHEDACSERVQAQGSTSPLTTGSVPLSLGCTCAKVLLVDDEPFNLLVLSAYLSSIGVKADKAENGRLALEMIENKADTQECCSGYTVVFMDINMPVMDGVETTVKIRQMIQQGTIGDCSIVAVTAAADLDRPSVYDSYIAKGFNELRKFAVVLNMFRIVSKPVQKQDFKSRTSYGPRVSQEIQDGAKGTLKKYLLRGRTVRGNRRIITDLHTANSQQWYAFILHKSRFVIQCQQHIGIIITFSPLHCTKILPSLHESLDLLHGSRKLPTIQELFRRIRSESNLRRVVDHPGLSDDNVVLNPDAMHFHVLFHLSVSCSSLALSISTYVSGMFHA